MERIEKHSDGFERFRQSFNSRDMSWIEDYDLDALSGLSGGERTLAVNMLIERLAEGDPRAPRAIAEIGAREAIRPLTQNLAKFNGEMLVEASMALWKLGGLEGAENYVLRVLKEDDKYGRIVAAEALRFFFTKDVVQALLSVAENDADQDVRTTAATSLLAMHRLMTSPYDSRYRDILILLDSDDKETRRKAIAVLNGLIAKSGVKFRPTSQAPSTSSFTDSIHATGAPITQSKFCGECGTKLRREQDSVPDAEEKPSMAESDAWANLISFTTHPSFLVQKAYIVTVTLL